LTIEPLPPVTEIGFSPAVEGLAVGGNVNHPRTAEVTGRAWKPAGKPTR